MPKPRLGVVVPSSPVLLVDLPRFSELSILALVEAFCFISSLPESPAEQLPCLSKGRGN